MREALKVIFDLDGTLADCSHRLHFLSRTAPVVDGDRTETISIGGCSVNVCEICLLPVGHAHHRSCPKSPGPDWNSFFSDEEVMKDKVIEPVAHILGWASRAHWPVIFTSRHERYRKLTEDWLRCHGLLQVIDSIHFRKEGDERSAAQVKKDMLRDLRDPVLFAIDDDPAVVEMYRENGVICLANKYHAAFNAFR